MQMTQTQGVLSLQDGNVCISVTEIDDQGTSRRANVEINLDDGAPLLPETRINLLNAREREKVLADLTARHRGYDWDRAFTEIAKAVKDAQPTAQKPSLEPPGETPRPTLDSAAYYGLAGDIVRAIEPHSESDPVALLVQLLVFFGNVIGRTAHARVEADRHFMNLFVGLIGATSKGRKGTSAGHIKMLFSAVDSQDAFRGWGKKNMISGLGSGEGLIWALRDPEGGEASDKRIFVMEPELGRVLRVVNREGSTLSAVIRDAWDTGDMQIATKNAPVRVEGAHVSIVGHITQRELLRHMTDVEASNGFANRFLWIFAQRSKSLPEGGNISDVDFGPIKRRLVDAIKFGTSHRRTITRTDEARALWAHIYDHLSTALPGLLGEVCARSEAQVLRLSTLYAILDESPKVQVSHLQAACALWAYSEDSARFIFGDTYGDSVAATIISLVRQSPDGITRTEISHALGRNKNAQLINQSIDDLVRQGRIRVERSEKGVRGRPAETILPGNKLDSSYEKNELNELIHKYLENKDLRVSTHYEINTKKFPMVASSPRHSNYFVINPYALRIPIPSKNNGLRINSYNSFNSYEVDESLHAEYATQDDGDWGSLLEATDEYGILNACQGCGSANFDVVTGLCRDCREA